MHVLIAPDSFKHSLSAVETSQVIHQALTKAGHTTTLSPIADGGEGTLETLLFAAGGEKITTEVIGPLGKPIQASFGINGDTAYLEMAEAAGIQHLQEDELSPWLTTTYGVGQLIKAASQHGAKQIHIGIGGSATNDGGIGMAQALGARFLDSNNQKIAPQNGTGLSASDILHITTIDTSNLQCPKITVLSDVSNPLLGPQGASHTYAAQKGANTQMIHQLEQSLTHLSHITKTDGNFPGAGAAGGLGFGLKHFCDATITPGIDFLINHLNLETHIQKADLIIIGEGQLDGQTMYGKAPAGIAKLAQKHNKPVIAIVGKIGQGYEQTLTGLNLQHLFSCYDQNATVELATIKQHGRNNLERLMEKVVAALPNLDQKKHKLTILS